jgi:GNAT superfamily N-acetyltransferase
MTPVVLSAVMAATWPAASTSRLGPWTLRDGAGGGKRVSAATADGDWSTPDLAGAEDAMRQNGRAPLFLIRAGEDMLDTALMMRGYAVIDPVIAYAAPLTAFVTPHAMTTFPHWPPLSIAETIWSDCGTDTARIAVMHRASGAKTVILSRSNDRPSGVAFVACHQNIAMLHALEVLPDRRRQGSAQNILRAAARWAGAQGADTLALVVTQANDAARSLYASAGMQAVGQYHYRQLPA